MLCCSQLTKLLASDHRNQLRMVQQLSVNATASNKSFCLLTSAALAACVITLYCTLQRPGLQQGTRDNVRLSIDGTFGTGRREGVWSSPADKRTIFSFTLASVDDLAMKIEKNYSRARDCNAVSFGSGWGEHTLCSLKNLQQPCYFYSFGIANDYSFDQAIAEKLGCYGFLADPTTEHPAKLGHKMTFHYMAAKSYHAADNKQWAFYTSMPGLRRFLGHNRVAILKMDCEGCEYSLARDILEEDPKFLQHIDQFAVEVHYSRKWLRGDEELYSLAALLGLLKESGLELVDMHNTQCSPADQATGLVPELEQRKVQMGLNGPKNESIWGKYGHCHNYLFARLR